MSDPHTDPTAGEPTETPENGSTPTEPGDDHQPPSDGPTPTEIREEGFNLGFGKGKAKAAKEIAEKLANDYGISLEDDPTEVRAALERGKSAQDEGGEVSIQARKIAELTALKAEMERELETLKARDDGFKVSRFKAEALSAGVLPEMVDDLVTVNLSRVRLTQDGTDLEVLSPAEDGTMVAMGTSLQDLVGEILKKKPAYRAPSGRAGGGHVATPTTPQEPKGSIYDHGDPRTFEQRLKDKLARK